MGRKRRPFFLTPALVNLSNQPPRLQTLEGEKVCLTPSLGTYPTNVSSNHRTHRTWICLVFSLWTRFPPRPPAGLGLSAFTQQSLLCSSHTVVPLASSSIAVEGGPGQRKKHCPISRSTLPISKGQQIDRSNDHPISSLLPAPFLPSLP